MIPLELILLIEKQPGHIYRRHTDLAKAALEKLEISPNSEFGEIYLNYIPSNFKSTVSNEYISDISEPTEEIFMGTEFIRDTWELPENYIAFTSLQGEGGYLLDKYSGEVWDFGLEQHEDFVNGLIPSRWSSFFDFIKWYISPQP